MMSVSFPKRSVLRQGCVLSVIVNAMAIFDRDSFPYYQWEASMYAYNGTDGDHAAIQFLEDSLIGTFYNHESNRSPVRCQSSYDLSVFFLGMPARYRPLADRCIWHWFVEERGERIPLVTAAVWDDGEYLTAAEPWEDVWAHGGQLMRSQLIEDLEAALADWQEGFQLSSPQLLSLAGSLFRRKLAHPQRAIDVEAKEVQFLKEVTEYPHTYEGGRRALAAIGINMPPWA